MYKKFLKPTKLTIIVFVVLLIVFFFFFTNTDTKIFPCQTQPIIPNPPPPKDTLCGLGLYIGTSITFTPLGFLAIIIVLLVIPYLIACAVNSIATRKNKS